jgi:hypothetical protein
MSHLWSEMQSITINGVEYETDSLTEQAKAQVVNLRFVQAELQRLEAKVAVYKTAEASYARALQEQLNPGAQ